jgi:flavin-dependent dehydrogenase
MLWTLTLSCLANDSICEPAQELPLAFDVDVLVAGGSLAGVEVSCAAAAGGARVMLVESRTYLGYDLCATQRLWKDADETAATPITRQLFSGKSVVTPFEVKRTLEQALIASNVQFLTGTYVDALLVNDSGRPSGITVVNHSGRQVVRAKVIIDATQHAVVTRQSEATFKPFKPGLKEVQVIVVGGELLAGLKGRKLADTVYRSQFRGDKARKFPVIAYCLNLPIASDSYGAFCAALNQARTMVFNRDLVDYSEHLIYYPENTIMPAAELDQDSSEAGELALDVFQAQGVEGLYVLNAFAGLERAKMEKIIRPISLAPVGRRIGKAAAKTAKRLASPGALDYPQASAGIQDLSIASAAASFRFRHCPKLKVSSRGLPILGSFDVVVVGGGTTGAPAGIGAARSGARTLVIESLDELGGVGAAGLIGKYWYGHRFGFTQELDETLGESWNVIWKSEWLRSELLKSGAEIWFGSFACGAVLDGAKVAGVIVATPYGRGVVLADVVIDATGNADVAAAAGAPTEFSISKLGDLSVQVAGYPHRNLGDRYNNTAFAMVDDRDVFDRWHLLLSTKQALKRIPYDMGQLIDTRERRRIIGDYTLSVVDILTHRKFPDTICHHRSNFDAGAFPTSTIFLIKDMKGPVYDCDMPIRCLLPKGLEGLLVTGLGASAERDAMTLTRMQSDLQNQGYAAGLAAALAVQQTGGVIRNIDIKELQASLVEVGCLEKRVLIDRDSFPLDSGKLEDAVKKLENLTIQVHQNRGHDDTFPALAAVIGHPEDSIPLLQAAFQHADAKNARINLARILAFLGDSSGKDILLAAVATTTGWDSGYEFTSHRETHNTFSETDRLVMALGFLRTPAARPLLIKKLTSLDADSDLSHFKAICLALRLNKDKSMTHELLQLLEKPGVSGHAQPLSYYTAADGVLKSPRRATTDRQGRNALNRKFKEVLVAALLYECGDKNAAGRKTLEAYTQDVNGHFAAYAHFVLKQRGFDAEQ